MDSAPYNILRFQQVEFYGWWEMTNQDIENYDPDDDAFSDVYDDDDIDDDIEWEDDDEE